MIWYQRAVEGRPSPCRFTPSCSAYALEAFEVHGVFRGSYLTVRRLLRCHPWGTHGIDRVPERLPYGARWWLPWRYGRWRGVNAG